MGVKFVVINIIKKIVKESMKIGENIIEKIEIKNLKENVYIRIIEDKQIQYLN